MLNVYSHLNGDDAGDEILRLHGLAANQKSEASLTIRTCPRCQEKVSSASRFCQRCGSPMDLNDLLLEEKRQTADRLLNLLLEDQDVRTLIAKKLTELDAERFKETSDKLREKQP